ncbi:MAG: ribosome biogenesis GTP-binding protein YihA/YsxC [Bacteroidota bacterium]|jgi:GTP-binding protein
MNISSAIFVKSASKPTECPKPNKPEFAFIGRSNVGKSSLINMICNNKNLAKTSATPGKTKLINHFLINDEWYLADLPGYGYAKVGKEQKSTFETIISGYCSKRENLISLFVLIDSRLSLQKIDQEFMYWCGENEIPFVIVFTKTDKLTKNELNKSLSDFKKSMLSFWEEVPQIFISSAEKSIGRNEILKFIEENKIYFEKK